MQEFGIMLAVATPKARRKTITVTVNEPLMDDVDYVASETGRNRSEMLDRVIEFYLANHPEAAQHRRPRQQNPKPRH
jgi:metal-responsive CopG/Arc/MetJ family transcriptional regulator